MPISRTVLVAALGVSALVGIPLWFEIVAHGAQLTRPDETGPSSSIPSITSDSTLAKGAPQDARPAVIDGAPPPLPDFPDDPAAASNEPAPLTAEQQAWLDQKAKLIASIEKQRTTSPFAPSPQIETLLNGDAKVFGAAHEETVRSLDVVATTYFIAGQFDRATKVRELIYTAKKTLYGEQDWRTREARWVEQQYGRLAKVPRAMLTVMAEADAETSRADVEFGKNQYRQSLATAKSATAKFEQVYGAEVPPTADALTLMSMNYIELSDLAQAEITAQKAADIYRAWYSTASPQYAAKLRNLGWIRHLRGSNAEAERLLRQAVEIGDQVPAGVPRDQAETLLKLGFLLARTGRSAQGIEMLQRALPAVEQTFGPEHGFYLDAAMSLCDLYSVRGDFAQAESIIATLRAQKIQHPLVQQGLTTQLMRKEAMLRHRQGKQDESRALYEQVLSRLQAAPGGATPAAVADLHAWIGRTYEAQQRREDAERLYSQALAEYRSLPNASPQEVRAICQSLVTLQGRMAIGLTLADKLEEARRKLEEAAKLSAEVMGNDDPVTQRTRERQSYQMLLAAASPAARPDLVEAETQTVAGNGHYDKGEYAEALAAYSRALELSQRHLPPDSERMGAIYHGLAYCAWGQQRYDVAEVWRRRSEPVFAKQSAAAGQATLQYAQTLRDIGDLCRRRSNFTEAADYLARAMDAYRPLKSPPAIEVLSTLEQLSQTYAELRDEVRCRSALAEYLDRVRNLYGPKHVKYFQAILAQADTQRKLGQFEDARKSMTAARDTIVNGQLDASLEIARRYLAASIERDAGNLDESRAKYESLLADLQNPIDLSDALQVTFDLVGIDRRQGRLDQARQRLEQSLKQAQLLPEAKSAPASKNLRRQLAELLGDIADQNRRALKFAESAAAMRELLDIQTAAAGDDHWTVREVRLQLTEAERLAQLDADQMARLSAAQQALDESRRLGAQQQFDQALAAAQQSGEALLTICGEQSTFYLAALDLQVSILKQQERYPQAEALLRRRLALVLEVLPANSAPAATDQLNLARNLFAQGKFDESRQAAEQSAQSFAQAGAADHPSRGVALTVLGNALVRIEKLPAAQQAYDLASLILAPIRVQQPTAWADLLQGQMNLALQMQDGPRSKDLAQRSLVWTAQHAGKNSPEYAQRLFYLGQAELIQSRPQAAVEVLQQALDILQPLQQAESFLAALLQQALSSAQLRVGNLPAAQQAGERAAALFDALQKTGEAQSAQIDLANVNLVQGDLAPAEKLLRNVVDGRSAGKPTTEKVYRRALNTLAGMLVARGDGSVALPLVHEILAEREAWLEANADILTDRLEASWRTGARESLDRLVVLAARGDTGAAETYEHVLRWKGSLYARQRRLRELRSDAQAAPLLARWGSLCGSLATLSLRAPYPEEQALWNARVAALSADKDEVERNLWALNKSRPTSPPTTIADLQRQLPKDSALVDFLEYEQAAYGESSQIVIARRFAAFVVRGDAPVALIDLGETVTLAALVENWRQKLLGDDSSDPDPAAAAQIANQLKVRLWTPLEQHLDGVKTVLVAPEGALGKLPFAALPGREPNSFLIDERAFVTIAAPGLIPELTARRRSPAELGNDASLLLVGDIDYGAAPGQLGEQVASVAGDSRSWLPYRFRELPGFGPEIADIRKAFGKRHTAGKVQLLERQAATEQAFRTAAAKYRWLHIATHGFFAPDVLATAAQSVPQAALLSSGEQAAAPTAVISSEGLTSGLALAGANKINEEGQDDGILSALEVATLDLSGVEMAVLSACETGLGESVGGESVVGLQRAFQVAGARSTVTSLWPVSDAATRLLMARFYRNLWNQDKPLSRLEALTEAQRWMIRAARSGGAAGKGKDQPLTADDLSLPAAFQLPNFWAAFVLGGDWQ